MTVEITQEIAAKIKKNANAALDMNVSICKLMDEPQECQEALALLHKALDTHLCRITYLLEHGREK